MKKVLGIFGAAGLAREFLETVLEVNRLADDKAWDEIVFVDIVSHEEKIKGLRVLSEDEFFDMADCEKEAALAIGEPSVRKKVIDKVRGKGYDFATIIHPSVHIPEDTCVGKGCYIAPHTFISCNVKIGDCSLIQPNVNIGHDCVLGQNVSVCGMTSIGGKCQVGDNTLIAMNVAVKEASRIGHDAVVGMGSVVAREIPDAVIAIGNPARAMRRNEGQKVLD